jgi:hypothetical protein
VRQNFPKYCTFQKVRQNFPEYLGFVEEILARIFRNLALNIQESWPEISGILA